MPTSQVVTGRAPASVPTGRADRPWVVNSAGVVGTIIALASATAPTESPTADRMDAVLGQLQNGPVLAYVSAFLIASVIVSRWTATIENRGVPVALALLAAASVGCAITSDPGGLAISRAIEGASGGVLMVVSLAAILATTFPELLTAATTAWCLLIASTIAVGPLVVAFIVAHTGLGAAPVATAQALACFTLAVLAQCSLRPAAHGTIHPLYLTSLVAPAAIGSVAAAVALLLHPAAWVPVVTLAGSVIVAATAAYLTRAVSRWNTNQTVPQRPVPSN